MWSKEVTSLSNKMKKNPKKQTTRTRTTKNKQRKKKQRHYYTTSLRKSRELFINWYSLCHADDEYANNNANNDANNDNNANANNNKFYLLSLIILQIKGSVALFHS